MRSASRVTWHGDTLREMASWAAKKYGLGTVYVSWRDDIRDKTGKRYLGCTKYLSPRAPFCIELLATRSPNFLMKVLAHELAHCVALKEHHYSGHGPRFVETLTSLIAAWNQYRKET